MVKPLLLPIALVALGLLSGCAGTQLRPEPPRVTIADLGMVDATLFAQRYRVRLDIQNPNSFDLPIDGMQYELILNGSPFASGVSNQEFTIPRYGSESIEVEAQGTLAGIFRQLSALERGRPQSIRYSLRGHVSTPKGFGRLPFDYGGEIDLVPARLGAP